MLMLLLAAAAMPASARVWFVGDMNTTELRTRDRHAAAGVAAKECRALSTTLPD
jgi:hypothetical protein